MTLNYGLLLWGRVGTGKSYFAGCIANALMEQEVPVCMTNFAAILNDLAASFAGRNEYISRLCSFPLLIIDDFGMERGTEYGPVSYTHLDVYKRQDYSLPAVQGVQFCSKLFDCERYSKAKNHTALKLLYRKFLFSQAKERHQRQRHRPGTSSKTPGPDLSRQI